MAERAFCALRAHSAGIWPRQARNRRLAANRQRGGPQPPQAAATGMLPAGAPPDHASGDGPDRNRPRRCRRARNPHYQGRACGCYLKPEQETEGATIRLTIYTSLEARTMARSATRALAASILRVYRIALSPLVLALFGPACRFEPSCSEYAQLAIRAHG